MLRAMVEDGWALALNRWAPSQGRPMIRLAKPEDLGALPAIEVAAGESFRALGMDRIADDPPPSLAALAGYQAEGRAWVATDGLDNPVAYVLVKLFGVAAHIEQVTVHPDHAGKRLGAGLIDAVADWARGEGIRALTLTTFEDVPWNAPYYGRIGFRIVPREDWGSNLLGIVAAEALHGLGHWPRVVMRRELPSHQKC